jgi:hypothetical protein
MNRSERALLWAVAIHFADEQGEHWLVCVRES